MTDGTLIDELSRARQRVAALAAEEMPTGLTDPDPDTPEERWDAAQVWAHVAEFVGYWHAELERVVGDYDGAPVPFGRTKTDAGRISAIEIGRHRPIRDLAGQADAAVTALEGYLRSLPAEAWQSRGVHPTRGVLDVDAIVTRFVTNHLVEHAIQLEGLAASA